ncbi:MAG: hypothetical protein NTW96_25760 [Planctomycetia bacterium]|nr:hypothetical protein [Planctomycetia bacterium]
MARKRDGMLGVEFGRIVLRLKRVMAAQSEKMIRENPAAAREIAEIHVKAIREIDLIPLEGTTVGSLCGAALAEETAMN